MNRSICLAFIFLGIPIVAGDEGCPPGWVNSVEGCFLFENTLAVTWRDAQEECEGRGGFLAEVKTEEQAVLLSSLAVVQENVLGITAWWIGLTDQGHEGRWIWQHSVQDTNYTNWATNYPDYANSYADCAVMISRDSFMWSNTDCDGLAASPVCQREAAGSEGTTTVDTATTTVDTATTTVDTATTTVDTATTMTVDTTTLYSDHVELRGGSMSEGNVFAVNNYGYLGPICDDMWGQNEAMVVCRQLGFSSGTPLSQSYFGSVPSKFAMDDVDCEGDEDTIQQCWSTDSYDNCDEEEGAGVRCYDFIQ